VSGGHAEWVETLWTKTGGDVKNLSAITQQLSSVQQIAAKSDYGVNRFFVESDHLPEENIKALDLLLTEKEPLKSMDSIADIETKEYLVADEVTLKAWKAARADIKAIKLNPIVVQLLTDLAARGATYRVARIVATLGEIVTVISPTSEVLVQSAVELSAAQKKDIKAALKDYLPANKKEMNMEYEVDTALTGGLIVQLDSVTVDLSSTSILVAATAAAQGAEARA
jgi:F0F1-type ATP synthase delta subunit